MRKLFGTDGIRGTANREPMTAETALRVAMAAGWHFKNGEHRHKVIIGKDTRLSNYMLEPAMQAGFASMGMDVILVGPMPTPGVAMLTRSLRANLGVVLSASHNAFEDNGIKLFGPDGYKLSDEVELTIETLMAQPDLQDKLAPPAELGRAWRLEDAAGRYIESVKRTFPRGARLDGLKIVLDCANGAAYKVAPAVFYELGAELELIGTAPDGTNINRACGATATDAMRSRVVETGADLGIALDGDADRVIVADDMGKIVNGDQLMAIIAGHWQANKLLRGDGIVATVMSNLGLERHLADKGLTLHRVQVGDRYVIERMRNLGLNLGGEQSGHIILTDFSTTGDGLVAALQVLAVLVADGRPMHEVGRVFEPYPQILRNVPIDASNGANQDPLEDAGVKAAIAAAETELGPDGRLLIRKSGTEPIIRVMAEGRDDTVIGNVTEALAGAISRAAG
ncbi:MAG: phosphoglucosamine mutase [Alphaproteobacteria bacterium]|nr:phosphoglucosamine mutase [Alphaproteobacteria bacterium]